MSADLDARWDRGAESRFMVEKDGYVMVSRPGCVPYVMQKREWMKLPLAADGKKWSDEYKRAAR